MITRRRLRSSTGAAVAGRSALTLRGQLQAGLDGALAGGFPAGASIMVTAHTYADLYDSDLDRVADALDGLRD